MTTRPHWLAALPALALPALFVPLGAHSQPADGTPITTLPAIRAIATTPLPGVGLDVDQIAAPVQTATGREIQDSQTTGLGDFLNRRIGGVYINETQGNPLQPDINYRGYTASPLLGTPQGLSVYMDGVRLNQPFGDVVSWDLIPTIAIATTTLMPGSNPLFGLNTLGGAISIETKNGLTAPGTSVELGFGTHQRKRLQLEHGGSNDLGLDWYVAADLFKEDGWREDSPSEAKQVFGKLGWHDARTQLHLTYSHANNDLTGNGLQEQQLLARDYTSVYTKPDNTRNRSDFLNLAGSRELGNSLSFSGNAYVRRIVTSTFNGDLNDDSLDQSVVQPSAAEQAALIAAGYSGFPTSGANASNTPFPKWRCIGQSLLNDEPAEKCNGLLNSTNTNQRNEGLSGQITSDADLLGRKNQFVVGGAFDRSRVAFTQNSQLGYLDADRSITPVNSFGDGVNGGNVDGVPYDTRVDLSARTRTWSTFLTDTLTVVDNVNVTLSGRYNRVTVTNRDHIHADGAPDSLSGHQVFQRFNPAFGLTWSPSRSLNAYFGYTEGSRAPTAIELGCANPEEPCKLPNAMAGDPPLSQVVTRTFDAGLRGRFDNGLVWNAGVFRADNTNDIQFVADNQSGFGYFTNFGKTRRQGFDLGLSGKAMSTLTLGGNYTFLDATYQSSQTFNGSSNSSNSSAAAGTPGLDGTIDVKPGDRMPLIPRHMFKAFADLQVTPAFTLSTSMVAVAGSIARGNENDQHQPDGVYYLGPGRSGGYAVFNLGGRYKATPNLQVFGQVSNLFDRQYATAAQLGSTGFNAAGQFVARALPPVTTADGTQYPVAQSTFYAPGSPRTVWVGVRYTLDGDVGR
ncbi:MAG: TonB-dependent receptor [Rhizobacter sp.]|nr:TonB-dependent receptor [Rhizobacter sp.]